MKNDRQMRTAQRFGILSECESLETDLLKIPGVVEVEFDLDGYFDDMHEVIFLAKYDIPVTLPNYYETRHKMVLDIAATAEAHGLTRTGDRVEDYGEHFYFVRHADARWDPKTKTEVQNHD